MITFIQRLRININYKINIKGDNMEIKINYLGVCVIIDVNAETITIISDMKSKELLNMVFKAILSKININTDGYKIINNTNCY